MKTVKCPECKAEQAIIRETADSEKMNCVFCGAEIALPEYTEDENLPDTESTPERISVIGEPVECDFILKRDEVETALMSTGRIRKRKGIVWAETGVLAFFIIVMAVAVIGGYNGLWGLEPPDRTTWFTLVLAAVLIPFVWIMPNINKKKMIDRATNGTKVALKIYENLIEIAAESDESWQLTFDEGYNLVKENSMMMLVMNTGQILAVPERAFRDCDLETAKKRIELGKKPPAVPTKKK